MTDMYRPVEVTMGDLLNLLAKARKCGGIGSTASRGATPSRTTDGSHPRHGPVGGGNPKLGAFAVRVLEKIRRATAQSIAPRRGIRPSRPSIHR